MKEIRSDLLDRDPVDLPHRIGGHRRDLAPDSVKKRGGIRRASVPLNTHRIPRSLLRGLHFHRVQANHRLRILFFPSVKVLFRQSVAVFLTTSACVG